MLVVYSDPVLESANILKLLFILLKTHDNAYCCGLPMVT